MHPWYAKSVLLAASVVMIAIRAPYGQRSRRVAIAKDGKGALEKILLTIAWVAFFVPIVWVFSPWFDFAEYALHPAALAAGVALYAAGLWLFYKSHADLGDNWSITLQVRQQHTLVTRGVYRRVRHPMYTAILLYTLGQTLVIPNWLAGPTYLAAMVLLIALRLRPEEQMMLDKFGEEYAEYQKNTKRLVPWVW